MNTLIYYIIYYFVTKKACIYYKIYYIISKNKHIMIFIRGFLISAMGLIFQEIVGHKLGGDIPSRFEGIPNAILYAKYYSIYHFIK